MKLPNLFFKFWGNDQTEPDMPKLGIDWFFRKACHSSPWAGICIYLIFFGRRLDITFTSDTNAYVKDMQEYAGIPLLRKV